MAVDESKREVITPADVEMISRTLGFGSIILDLHLTDYSLGAYQSGDRSKCFWLKDGRRVDISMSSDGGIFSSVTNEPDKDRPTTKLK